MQAVRTFAGDRLCRRQDRRGGPGRARPHDDRARRDAQQARLGANAISACRASPPRRWRWKLAAAVGRTGRSGSGVLPVPMMNVVNGGAHANAVDFQEFMVVPVVSTRSRGRCRQVARCSIAEEDAADRGPARRLRPRVASRPTSSRTSRRCRCWSPGSRPRLPPGDDVAIALGSRHVGDHKGGAYELEHEGRTLSSPSSPTTGRPGLPLSDPLDRGRHGRGGLGRLEVLTDRIGTGVSSWGDDLFVTNTERLQRGIDAGVANSILVK